MLVIAGTIEIDPSKLEGAKAAAIEMMAATRKEPGNVAYVFSSDFEGGGIVHVFEQWESQEALDEHFESPHMAKFRQAMGGFGIKGMALQKYEIASVGPL